MNETTILDDVMTLLMFDGFFERVFGAVNSNILEERNKELIALRAIRKALRETRLFIQEKGYVPNGKLSELWHEAFEAASGIKVFRGDRIVVNLYDRSRYWEDPETWSLNPVAMALVPQLLEVEDKCEILLKELTK